MDTLLNNFQSYLTHLFNRYLRMEYRFGGLHFIAKIAIKFIRSLKELLDSDTQIDKLLYQ